MSKTTTGVWIGTSPRIVVDETEPPAVKVEHVRDCLRKSRQGVPHPTDWDSFLDPFLKEVGAKSWSAFAKNALSCSVDLEGDQFVLLPYRNSGPKDHYAFLPIEDGKLTISSDASDEELGPLLEKAFDACE